MITEDNFKKILEYLGYTQKANVFTKKFVELDFELKVDFKNSKLIYPENKGFIVNERQTCNFKQPENFVVFECVNRLLTQGYHPKHIELEPKWQVGHGASGGRADILVKDNDDKALLIIECKTAGNEFTRAWNTTQTKPTQLFSYVQQTRSTKFIALYTSDYIDNKILPNYYLINIIDNKELLKSNSKLKSFKDATTVEEIYQVWTQTYEKDYSTLGIFENNQAYDIGKTKFSIEDLQPVSSKDIQEKYNKFASILRKYNVSGRENAFDKLVNLFLCKVVDETENKDELKFYWKGKAYDNPFDFQDRIQQLYKDGMFKFLGEEITYIDNSQIDDIFKHYDLDTIKTNIKDVLKEQKFFTNNDFAFIDVHNKKLFYQNFQVLLDIARLIQDINLTNSDENQFLGDMFEGFLDQGVKQSEGQFFTPMPIVKFIINSLPNKQTPKVIDYACGAGHFLNEYYMENKDSQIIGIEKEYRLSKVAKVSSFMYGSDDKTNIVYTDGLSINEKIKNDDFDVLIANPPYSVKGFLETLSNEDRDKFELTSTIEEKSYTANNAIECFFIERAKQLLCKDAVAGIIVPSSILNKGSQNINTNKGNVYVGTREIILKYFDIVAITEFGSGTFGKTGTNTVTLFLKRRCDSENLASTFEELSNKLFDCKLEFTNTLSDKDMLQKYCNHIEIDYEIYKSILCNTLNDNIFKYDIFKEYQIEFNKLVETKNRKKKTYYKNLTLEKKEEIEKKEFLKYIKLIEKDKFFYYCLAYKNKTDVVIVKSPSKNAENKKFLGYDWSTAKGNEGIQYITKSSVNVDDSLSEEDKRILENLQGLKDINTPLYNPNNKEDITKINKIIKDNFDNIKTNVHTNLKQYVSRANVVDMLDFSRVDFNKALSLTPSKKMKIESKYPVEKLINISKDIIAGGDKPKNFSEEKTDNLNIPIYSNSVTEKGLYGFTDTPRIIENSVTVSARGTIGYTVARKEPFYPIVRLIVITPKLELVNIYYLEEVLNFYGFESNGAGVAQLPVPIVENTKIPLPPLGIQEEIVKECQKIDRELIKANKSIDKTQKEIEQEMSSIQGKMIKLETITSKIGSGATPKGGESSYKESGISLIRSQNIYDDGFEEEGLAFIDENQAKKLDNVTVEENDILFNITGASVARCCIIESKYLPARVNQHVSIIRPTEKVIPEYLQKIITSKSVKNSLITMSKTSSTREAITKVQLENFKIIIPSIEIQKQIILKIKKLEDKINKAKKIIDNSKGSKEKILRKYL